MVILEQLWQKKIFLSHQEENTESLMRQKTSKALIINFLKGEKNA